jgi:hypothetical protein
MTEIGSVHDQMAIEFDTRIYLFKDPGADFNEFWNGQTGPYTKFKNRN